MKMILTATLLFALVLIAACSSQDEQSATDVKATLETLLTSTPTQEPTPTSTAALDPTSTNTPAPEPTPTTKPISKPRSTATLVPPTAIPKSTPLPPPMPTATFPPTATILPTATPEPLTPTATPLPTSIPSPTLAELKDYMLDLINEARAENGAGQVVFGDNAAAQVHAEASLRGCFLSHWGMDGTKPDMRYNLAGGHQYARENISGQSHCVKAGDGFRAIANMPRWIERSMSGLLNSPGHFNNIVDPKHRKVNIGLAKDAYNVSIVQQFEGDYVEYEQLPQIRDGVVSMSGSVVNGATLADPEHRDGLSVAIYFDPPLRALNRGHLARTSCVVLPVKIASLRRPPKPGAFYDSDEFARIDRPCPDPYNLPADLPEPEIREEAKALKSEARSKPREPVETTGKRITALMWDVAGDSFNIEAGIQAVLDEHGPGIYTVVVWANLNGEQETVSEYAIFYNTPPPNTDYSK